jgi:uncharacterized protein
VDSLLTDRTRLRRLPARGAHDRAAVHAILDAGFVCHVGFVAGGQPYVIPTGYARAHDTLYIHGSTASRLVRTLAGGLDVCVTVTLVDGFVLARSAFHHSLNYRSVVVLGRARLVSSAEEKLEALRRFTDHIASGRFEEARRPTDQELKGTAVLALALEEASAKIRSGPPLDDPDDLALKIWAGVVPLRQVVGEPQPDPHNSVAGPFDTSRLVVMRR